MDKLCWFSINRAILFVTLITAILFTVQINIKDNQIFNGTVTLQPFDNCPNKNYNNSYIENDELNIVISNEEIFTSYIENDELNIVISNEERFTSYIENDELNIVISNEEIFTYLLWACTFYGIVHILLEYFYFKGEHIHFLRFISGETLEIPEEAESKNNQKNQKDPHNSMKEIVITKEPTLTLSEFSPE